jgi:dolichol-phosphate mannosyltransferase
MTEISPPILDNSASECVGVVIPAYKEAENIGPLIEEISRHFPSARIVVVDDSPDQETASAFAKLNPANGNLIHRDSKGGRGSAVIAGISFLLGHGCTRILEMDADFSHPPAQIQALMHEATSCQADLLIASRYLPLSRIENWPLSRRIFSRCANLLARSVLGVPISDYTNGYRVYSERAARLIVKTCGKLGRGFIPLSEILVNLYYRGMKVSETPTIFVNRIRGESSVNFAEIKDAAFGLAKIYLLKLKLKKHGRLEENN